MDLQLEFVRHLDAQTRSDGRAVFTNVNSIIDMLIAKGYDHSDLIKGNDSTEVLSVHVLAFMIAETVLSYSEKQADETTISETEINTALLEEMRASVQTESNPIKKRTILREVEKLTALIEKSG